MNKKTFFALALIFLILLATVYIVIQGRRTKESPLPPIQQITPAPTSQLPPSIPTIPPFSVSPLPKDLILLRVNPPEDPTGAKFYGPNDKITFTFNKILDLNTFSVETSPKINLEASYKMEPSELTLIPAGLEYWKPDTLYTITIKKGLKANDGSLLQNDITYQMKARLQGGE